MLSETDEKTLLLQHEAPTYVSTEVRKPQVLRKNKNVRMTQHVPQRLPLSSGLSVNGDLSPDSDLSINEEEAIEENDVANRELVQEKTGPRQEQETVEIDEIRNLRKRFYITISILIIVFIGCMDMSAVTLKQFVYSWCRNRTMTTGNLNHSTYPQEKNTTNACGNTKSSTESAAQKLASRWELYFNLIYSVLVFVAVSTYGTLSDFYGRKPFLCLALICYTLKCAVIAIVIYFDLHIAWIIIAFAIDGLGGSAYAVSMFAYICTADITQKSGSSMVAAIAIMEVILGFGRVSTQFGNGYFIHHYGFFYPMLTSFIFAVFCVIFTLVAFKETNTSVLNQPAPRNSRPTCATLVKRYFSFYFKREHSMDRIIFWLCLSVFVFFEIGLQGRSDPIVLYQLGSPFCWSSEEIGWYGAESIALSYVIGCLLLKPLQLCMTANSIACIGLVSAIVYNIVTGLATSTLWLYIATGSGVVMILPKPILRGLASTKAADTEQGAMFAGLQASELVCKMIASPGSLSIYSATVDTMAGIVFFVLAGFNALALLFMISLSYAMNVQTKEPSYTVIQTN